MRRNAMLILSMVSAGIVFGCRSPKLDEPSYEGEQVTICHDLQLVQDASYTLRTPVRSWKSLKNENVVLQKYDYSCGAAALTTMIRYYFEDDATEDEVLKATLKELNEEQLKDRLKNGLSMNDLFKTAKSMGYLGTVYKLPLEKIPELKAPVIVRIEKFGYKHFVVLRGSVEDRIYLADPVRGNIRLSVAEFVDQWSGEALILGKKGFGLPDDYPLAIHATPPVRNELETVRHWLLRRPQLP